MTEHEFYKCPSTCEDPNCNFCMGGLAYCTVCRGAEGSLATECPGVLLSEQQEIEVYNGGLDFVEGRWVRKYPEQTKSC